MIILLLCVKILAVYLQRYPKSSVALNLKACNHFRLYNGKAAMAELKPLFDEGLHRENDLVRHNIVVFREGAKVSFFTFYFLFCGVIFFLRAYD